MSQENREQIVSILTKFYSRNYNLHFQLCAEESPEIQCLELLLAAQFVCWKVSVMSPKDPGLVNLLVCNYILTFAKQ